MRSFAFTAARVSVVIDSNNCNQFFNRVKLNYFIGAAVSLHNCTGSEVRLQHTGATFDCLAVFSKTDIVQSVFTAVCVVKLNPLNTVGFQVLGGLFFNSHFDGWIGVRPRPCAPTFFVETCGQVLHNTSAGCNLNIYTLVTQRFDIGRFLLNKVRDYFRLIGKRRIPINHFACRYCCIQPHQAAFWFIVSTFNVINHCLLLLWSKYRASILSKNLIDS